MHPTTAIAARAAFLPVLFLLTAPAPAQEAKPDASPPVRKMEIWNGPLRTVYYSLLEGSPHRQALYRILQWAENEVTIADQLQQLKLAYVGDERQLEAFRMAPQFGYAPWLGGGGCWAGVPCESSLKAGLSGVLTQEATPEAALRLIRLLEQAQTDVATERKAGTSAAPMPHEQAEALARALIALVNRSRSPPAGLPIGEPKPSRSWPRPFVVDSRTPFAASTVGRPRWPWPSPTRFFDPDRAEIERARQVLQQERETFQQARAAYLRLPPADVSKPESARNDWQAAQERWSGACKQWSEACRLWSEVCARRAEANRKMRFMLTTSGSERPAVTAAPTNTAK
jgi:hypothetical protein